LGGEDIWLSKRGKPHTYGKGLKMPKLMIASAVK